MIEAIVQFKNRCSIIGRLVQSNTISILKYLIVFLLLSAIMASVRTTPSLSYENNWSVKDLFSKNGLCGRVTSTVKMKISLEKLCLIEICVQSVLATIGMFKINKHSWLMILPWTLSYIYFSIVSIRYWSDVMYRISDEYINDTRLSVDGMVMFGSYYVLLNSVFIYKMVNLDYSKFIQYQIEDEIKQFEKQMDELVD